MSVSGKRSLYRKLHLCFSILNLGYLATNLHEDQKASFSLGKQHLIPISDVFQAIRFIISCSKYICIKEIDMPALMDENV